MARAVHSAPMITGTLRAVSAVWVLALCSCSGGGGTGRPAASADAKNVAPHAEARFAKFDGRVEEILRRMTLEEKIGQLVQFSGGTATGPEGEKIDRDGLLAQGGIGSFLNVTGANAVNALQKRAVGGSRFRIPLIMGLDVIHGYRTTFPVPLGMAASWDMDLIEASARVAAVEATSEGIRWTFSPMVDIARDARWGRIMEGAGEDPYLGGAIARAYVRGYQGKDLTDPTSMVACAKHLVAYGGAEGGRDYNTVDMSERTLRDVYLPPFRDAVDEGAGTVMSAFNTLQGVPTSANRFALTDVLRSEWGFEGLVVSDWMAVGQLVNHGIALDGEAATLKAITAGVDIDMQTNLYAKKLAGLVRSGKLKESVIDEAARRVLRIKFALGLFEHPYTDESLSAKVMLRPEHIERARQAAEASFVLLKNDEVGAGAGAGGLAGGPLLPLKDGQTVALIGPLADDAMDMLGEWDCKGDKKDVTTLRQALGTRIQGRMRYAKGTEMATDSEAGFDSALAAAAEADVVVVALGESRMMSGEAASRTKIGLPGNQLKLLQAVVATGKPVVLVVFSGRPLALAWEATHVPAMLEAWFPGVQAGPALVRTLFGEVSPSGKLTASFPRSVGQEPLYYNALRTGRPVPTSEDPGVHPGVRDRFVSKYLDEDNSALFPFGWGLSYTSFEYSPTRIATRSVRAADLNGGSASVTVEATVTNAGQRAGAEVVQLYIRQRGTSVARPVRELKGFQKITLAPGESRVVRFTLGKKELAFWNIQMRDVVEPGELTVWVAPSSVGGKPDKILVEP